VAQNVPTAAQLTQLAALQSTLAAANATLIAAEASFATARSAQDNAARAVLAYSNYIYQYPSIDPPGYIDESATLTTY
jgi:hypothetical protein